MRRHSTLTGRGLTAPQPFNKMATKSLPRSRGSCGRLSLMPNNSEPNFAGIEVASNTMRGVVISTVGDVIAQRDITYQPENLIGEIAQLVAGLGEAGPLKSVGLGIPGLVNRETDRVLISTGKPDWGNCRPGDWPGRSRRDQVSRRGHSRIGKSRNRSSANLNRASFSRPGRHPF